MSDSACLAGESATLNGNDCIVLINSFCSYKGLTNDNLKGLKTEVIVDVSLVNSDVTLAGYKINTGYGRFSSAGAVLFYCL